MKKIMFNDKYGLTAAVLKGYKTMMRMIIPIDICNATDWKAFNEGDMKCYGTFEGDWVDIRRVATYQVSEVVAVAQNYESMANGGYLDRMTVPAYNAVGFEFKPDLMPHRIRITDIKVERLQDISDEDCIREGIGKNSDIMNYSSPCEAFSALIDKVSGKGTWERNPYVFAYTFELIK